MAGFLGLHYVFQWKGEQANTPGKFTFFHSGKESEPMPRKKVDPAKNKYRSAEERAPDTPHAADTLPEWCVAFRISLSMFYKQQAAGKGPRVSYIGTKAIITRANTAAYLKQIEMQPRNNDSTDASP
jgi:hypothetical protein